jgi:hypothetical protein
MRDYEVKLLEVVNDWIAIQREADCALTVIEFTEQATLLYERGTAALRIESLRSPFGKTDFAEPLKIVLEVIDYTPSGLECEVTLFTDGIGDIPYEEIEGLKKRKIRMNVIGFGWFPTSRTVRPFLTYGGTITNVREKTNLRDVFPALTAK